VRSRRERPRGTVLPGLLSELQRQLAARPEVRRWVVALSGGLDSSLLLALMGRLAPPQPVIALHIDHQLQPGSAAWAQHCRRQCERLGVGFDSVRVNPTSASEAAAREARYRAFAAYLQPGDCLLLAQHGDDQAETLLLRLLRGAGVAGLAGMPPSRPLGPAVLLRPLLRQPRARLEQAAAEIDLEYIEDPSNQSTAYDRNFLRLHLLPGLKRRWPGLLARIADTAALMAEANELLAERGREDLAACAAGQGALRLDRLQRLRPARQRNLLHFWISEQTGHRLARSQLLQLERDLLQARADAQPCFRLPGYQLRRYRQGLYLLPDPLPAPAAAVRPLRAGEAIPLPLGQLQWRAAAVGLPPNGPLQLCFRRGGERLRPAGRGGSVSLKQLLQEAGLPPWLRPYQPLLVRDGEIVAVPGITLSETATCAGGLVPLWCGFGLSREAPFAIVRSHLEHDFSPSTS
jgi:tRNA(Ile)-lysidine synthase